MLVSLDACQDKVKVHRAYNDEGGKTHEFVLNGLLHANRLLDKDIFKLKDWKVIGEYDEASGRHQAFCSPVRDLVIDGAYTEVGERIRVEESYKYSSVQSDELWDQAGVVQQTCFSNSSKDYRKRLVPRLREAAPLQCLLHVPPIPLQRDAVPLFADDLLSLISHLQFKFEGFPYAIFLDQIHYGVSNQLKFASIRSFFLTQSCPQTCTCWQNRPQTCHSIQPNMQIIQYRVSVNSNSYGVSGISSPGR